MDSQNIPKVYYPNNVTKLLEENILVAKNNQGTCVFFIVEFVNLGSIIAIKGGENTALLLFNLCEYLQNNQITLSAILNHDRLLIIQHGIHDNEIDEFANNIFKLLHKYSYEKNDGVIYLQPIISSTKLNQNNAKATSILDECFIALHNIRNKSIQSFCQYASVLIEQSPVAEEMANANYFYKKIIDREIAMNYQPIVCSKTKEVHYYECLLRIIENKNLVSAGKYIQLAEKYGFIHEVDRTVIDIVCELIEHNQHDTYSINLSSACFEDAKVVNYLLKKIDDVNISERLIVEITETAVLGNLDVAKKLVAELKARKCKVALDDYGAGYTSLRNIKELSVDILKIDGCFIKDIEHNNDSIIYVKNIIELCKSLGIKVVAEFVSNDKIADILIKLEVDCLQGFYIDHLTKK